MSVYKFTLQFFRQDPRSAYYMKEAQALGFRELRQVIVQDLYFIEGQLSQENCKQLALKLLTDPVTQSSSWMELPAAPSKPNPDTVIVEVTLRPGVTDPVPGTIVGALERDEILSRRNLKAGDVLIGPASSGPHTNGYSLIRKVFADVSLDTVFPELDSSLADALLAPHRSYLSTLYPILPRIKALAHLTGGGFVENIPRVLPENLNAEIQFGSWPIPPLWTIIRQKGKVKSVDMYRVFNMGIGMIAIRDKSTFDKVQVLSPKKLLSSANSSKAIRKLNLSVKRNLHVIISPPALRNQPSTSARTRFHERRL